MFSFFHFRKILQPNVVNCYTERNQALDILIVPKSFFVRKLCVLISICNLLKRSGVAIPCTSLHQKHAFLPEAGKIVQTIKKKVWFNRGSGKTLH